uniref:Uncharacterized protein n=1 Tax=Romanomermis culicivorax TaxID=13658 RepID=A0A915JFG8_ROMCU
MKKLKTKEIESLLKCIFTKLPFTLKIRMEGRLHGFKNITSLAEFINQLKANTTVWREFRKDQEDGEDDHLN